MLEDLLMTVQRSLHLGAVGGIAVQNLIVSDQALGTLGQEDLVTEFHRWRCLPRLIRCVWDSKMEYTFSSGGTCSPSSTRRRVWLMTFSPRSQYAVICWRSWSIAVMDSLPEGASGGPAAVLSRFRQEFHACLTARRDEIFELADAVLCADGPVRNLAGVSLAPAHPP